MMAEALAYDSFFENEYSDTSRLPFPKRIRSIVPPVYEGDFSSSGEALRRDEEDRRSYPIPIKQVSDGKYRITFKVAIPAYLDGEDNQFVTIHEKSRIAGSGETPSQSLKDFGTSFVNIYQSYKESKTPLSLDAVAFLGLLDGLILRVEKL